MSSYDSIASSNIEEAIKENKTNRHALSRRTGIAYATLNRKLDGGSLTLEQLEKIASALNVRTSTLLVGAE